MHTLHSTIMTQRNTTTPCRCICSASQASTRLFPVCPVSTRKTFKHCRTATLLNTHNQDRLLFSTAVVSMSLVKPFRRQRQTCTTPVFNTPSSNRQVPWLDRPAAGRRRQCTKHVHLSHTLRLEVHRAMASLGRPVGPICRRLPLLRLRVHR